MGPGTPYTRFFMLILASPFRKMPDLSLGLTLLPPGELGIRPRHVALPSWSIDAIVAKLTVPGASLSGGGPMPYLWLLAFSSRPGIRRCLGTRPSNEGYSPAFAD